MTNPSQKFTSKMHTEECLMPTQQTRKPNSSVIMLRFYKVLENYFLLLEIQSPKHKENNHTFNCANILRTVYKAIVDLGVTSTVDSIINVFLEDQKIKMLIISLEKQICKQKSRYGQTHVGWESRTMVRQPFMSTPRLPHLRKASFLYLVIFYIDVFCSPPSP